MKNFEELGKMTVMNLYTFYNVGCNGVSESDQVYAKTLAQARAIAEVNHIHYTMVTETRLFQ